MAIATSPSERPARPRRWARSILLTTTGALVVLGLPLAASTATAATTGEQAPGFKVDTIATTTDTPPAPVQREVDPSVTHAHSSVTNPDGTITTTTVTQRAGGVGGVAFGPQSTIEVHYTGFTPAARASFQAAVDIWGATISSPVTIVVAADFSPLDPGVLGSAGPDNLYRNFTGAPLGNTWYPVALVNKFRGSDIDPSSPDIDASFSSSFGNFYFGTDGLPGAGQYDFESVVLHELGHGLGFVGSAFKSGSTYSIGVSTSLNTTVGPFVFDLFVQRGNGTSVFSHQGNSAQLGVDFTSNDLFFSGTNTNAANGGQRAKLYAPASWQDGSSYSHLDDATYPPASGNALMTPFLANGEVEHAPGKITKGMFVDMGWELAASAPDAPQTASAVGAVESANLSWTAPADNGGAPVTGYTITANPGGAVLKVGNVLATSFNGLTGGVPYTFSVAATNSIGTGPGRVTNSVTPTAAPNPGQRFTPVVPFRVLDSRGGVGFSGAVGQDSSKDVVVAGVSGIPASATAVVMNVTVTGGTAGSFLTLFPAGNARPLAANLNFSAGQTVPNLVTTKVGTGKKISVYNAVGSVDVIADVVGYYDASDSSAALFEGVSPARILDSRSNLGGWASSPLGEGASKDLTVVGGLSGVPATATAVVFNLTATGGTKASYLQVFPTGATQPVTANLLFGVGQTVPNLVTVGIGKGGANDGKVRIFNQLGSVNVIADVVGYYDAAGTGFFHPVNPTRMIDSRTGVGGFNTPWGAGVSRAVSIAGVSQMPVPAGATGLVMNTTVTGPTAASYLAVYPDGILTPSTANLLFGPSQTVPNLVLVKLAANGKLDIYNQLGSVQVIGDVGGYFATT